MLFDAIEVYTVTVLCCEGRCLLLQRASNKGFAPGRWTGLGGRVELDEFSGLRRAALREVLEESGIMEKDIHAFHLRRAMLTNRPGAALKVVLYFTGSLSEPRLPDCPEGQLSWLAPEQFDALDVIENTRPVLDCLIEDMRSDPDGKNPVVTGLGVFDVHGRFEGVTWGKAV